MSVGSFDTKLRDNPALTALDKAERSGELDNCIVARSGAVATAEYRGRKQIVVAIEDATGNVVMVMLTTRRAKALCKAIEKELR